MIKPTRWIDRKFNFDFPSELYPTILERLRGTILRIEEMTKDLSEDVLSFKPDGGWSIKEHIGHITDVEQIWLTRLDQFLDDFDTLVSADMSNRKTTEASHNRKPLDELIKSLEDVRNNFISKLDNLSVKDFSRTALHPRLNKPMRLVDMLYFVAEHDDNELALMRYKANLKR